MKLFITGATGLIGRQLAMKLAEKGHEVHVLYRSPEKIKGMEHPNLRFFKGDILSEASIEQAMTGCQAVFHLAAYAKLWAKDPATYLKINVEGTANVLNIARMLEVQRFILTSTAGVYGPSSNGKVTEETKRSMPYFNEYERTKSLSEQIALEYADESFELIILHPTRVYGPGLLSESNGVTRMIKLFLEGKFRMIPGNGKSVGNYAYIDNVVDGHIQALEKGTPNERYILGGENSSFNAFFRKLAEKTGRQRKMVRVPLPVLIVVAWLFELRTFLIDRPPLITPKWVKRYLFDWEISSQKAVDELGYQITPLDQGLEKTTAWLKQSL